MLSEFPDEWIVGLAQDWLNPREQRRLAMTSKRFYNIIPQPLRIQICHMKIGGNVECCCLGGDLFATPVHTDTPPTETVSTVSVGGVMESFQKQPQASPPPPQQQQQVQPHEIPDKKMSADKRRIRIPTSGPLDASSSLLYDQEYFLWKYDYEENCPVYLSRQLRQTQPPSLTDITNNNNNNNNNNGFGNGNNNNNNDENSRSTQYRFTVGYFPRTPTQSWKFISDYCGTTSDDVTGRSVVDPGIPLQLVVSGWQDRPGQVESTELHKLMPQTRVTHTGRPLWTWHTVPYEVKVDSKVATTTTVDGGDSSSGSYANDATASFAYTTSHLGRRREKSHRSDSDIFILLPSQSAGGTHQNRRLSRLEGGKGGGIVDSSSRRRGKGSQTFEVTQTYRLETFAIPDLSDRGAYLLYSPSRWQAQLAPSTLLPKGGGGGGGAKGTMEGAFVSPPYWYENGRITSVEFSFWITMGILYFKAHSLSFALAIPVVKPDREFFDASHQEEEQQGEESQAQPIINLYESYSARWGCIKYYMATAADVGEGCPFNLDVFLRGVTDHVDHRVEQLDHDIIAIQMKASSTIVDPTLVKDIPRDDSRIWKFFFSW